MLKKYYLQFKQSAVLDYSGTHSLFARINCYRNLSNFAVGCLLSRVSQQVATLYRKSAFTLAETLIVMGIIGVVAALTLPNLNSSTGEKEKVAKLQKIYSNLQDAFGRAQAVYGPYNEWFPNRPQGYEKKAFERIIEFMKVSKKCTISDNCTMTFDTNEGVAESVSNNESEYNAILTDGSVIAFHIIGISTITLYVDIDGPNKGQNSFCDDTFKFVYNHGDLNVANPLYDDQEFPAHYDQLYKYPMECTYWVITQGNMDYKKTTNDKCPDGQKLSESHPRCK